MLHVEHEGTRGVEATRRVQPCLVLLDIVMPSVNGLEVLRALKEDEVTKHIPVIVFSEHDNDEYVITAYRRYAKAFVRKRQDFKELCEVVEAIRGFWLRAALLPARGLHAVPN